MIVVNHDIATTFFYLVSSIFLREVYYYCKSSRVFDFLSIKHVVSKACKS